MTTLEGVNGTVCDALRYQQHLSSATSLNPSITCLTHGQSIGVALTAEASFISAVCLVVIFILIGRNVLRYRKVSPDGEWKLLRFPTDIFMFTIFIFDIVQAMGGILNVRWAGNGMVITGPYCTAQGIIKQIGELGTALISLMLAAHTFITALWGVGTQACGFTFGLVGLACVFTALCVGIGNGVHNNYEAPSPFWCWISPQFKGERLAGEYLWLWVALFASTMYIPVYLWANGRLSVGERWYKFRLSKPAQKAEYSQRRTALGMLFYPIAYSLVVLPLSAARWSMIDHRNVPSAAMFFGLAMFDLCGAVNVLLFLIVRPQILLFAPPEQLVEDEKQLSHLNTGPVIPTETAGCKCNPKPTGTGLAVDPGEGSWNRTFEGSRNVALSRASSTQKSASDWSRAQV